LGTTNNLIINYNGFISTAKQVHLDFQNYLNGLKFTQPVINSAQNLLSGISNINTCYFKRYNTEGRKAFCTVGQSQTNTATGELVILQSQQYFEGSL